MSFIKSFFSLIITSCFFYVGYVYSSAPLPANEAVYFCTKDLDTGPSTPGIEQENRRNDYIKVVPNIENSDNTILRHCFMMLGSKIASKDSHDYLIVQATMGFFNGPNSINEAVTMQESLYKKVISCTPIRVINSGEDEVAIWGKIVKFYSDEAKKGYDNFSHNCCTVAYDSIPAVSGDSTAIDARSFNFGVGIRWKFEDSGSSYGLLKSIGIVSDQGLYTSESVSPSSQSSKDDSNKDEL